MRVGKRVGLGKRAKVAEINSRYKYFIIIINKWMSVWY